MRSLVVFLSAMFASFSKGKYHMSRSIEIDREGSKLKSMTVCLRKLVNKGAFWSLTTDQKYFELCFGMVPAETHSELCQSLFNSDKPPATRDAIIYKPSKGEPITTKKIVSALEYELKIFITSAFLRRERQDLVDELNRSRGLVTFSVDAGFPSLCVRLPVLKFDVEPSLKAYNSILSFINSEIDEKKAKFWLSMHEHIDELKSKVGYREACGDHLFRSAVTNFMQYYLYENKAAYEVLYNENYIELQNKIEIAIKHKDFSTFLSKFVAASGSVPACDMVAMQTVHKTGLFVSDEKCSVAKTPEGIMANHQLF